MAIPKLPPSLDLWVKKAAGVVENSSRKLWKATVATCKSTAITCEQFIHGAPKEEPKEIVTRDWTNVCLKLLIHLTPVCATVTLAFLNLKGYFIGSQLQGPNTAVAQGMDRLALQVTAKLFELLVITSLSTIVMDAVRYHLLFATEGLPLGLLPAKHRYTDVSYLISSDFIMGCKGLQDVRRRALFIILVVTCAAVALFVSSAAALLMIPQHYDSWPAGGATFWINNDLNPPMLNSTSFDNLCLLPNGTEEQYLNISNALLTSCPWAGYGALKGEWMQHGPLSTVSRIEYTELTFRQTLSFGWAWHSRPYEHMRDVHMPRTWATGGSLAIGGYMQYISQVDWCRALVNYANQTKAGGWFHGAIYREYGETKATVRGRVPLVRCQCDHTEVTANPSDPSLLSLNMNFPSMTESTSSIDWYYSFAVPNVNDTQLTTQWIPVPSDGFGGFSGGHLAIRNVTGYGAIGCTVQAHWIPGATVASGLCDGTRASPATTQQAIISPEDTEALFDWTHGVQFGDDEPQPPQRWPHVDLSLDWLSALTPALDPSLPGRTTLASVLESSIVKGRSMPLTIDRIFGSERDFDLDMLTQVNAIVASFVADGMSRVGTLENHVYDLNKYVDYWGADARKQGWVWHAATAQGWWNNFLTGRGRFLPLSDYKNETGEWYKMEMTVAGYGLKADGTAYYLALVILLMHVLLVIAHICYTIHNRRVSFAWTSLIDLFALCLTSPPPDPALANCSAGVSTHALLKEQLRIRDCPDATSGHERLQLLMGDPKTGMGVNAYEVYGVRI
ncbi:hypothetical protein LTR17_002737 [Elasticomyces elasticus]|nr:hypothetical protein LTR17_002737 [Elasticomyces elasticus]